MFGNNNAKDNAPKSKSSSAPSGGGHSLNTISQGTVVEGTLKAKNDIRIDGTIKGNLQCEAKVIIGPTGFIEGEVSCDNAVVEGKFSGTLRVREMLNLRETAEVDGDVATGKLTVQPGCIFNVSCSMGSGVATKQDANRPESLEKAAKDAQRAKAKA
jgi:cytoskeletal protein CcmA (bactofilin family)